MLFEIEYFLFCLNILKVWSYKALYKLYLVVW